MGPFDYGSECEQRFQQNAAVCDRGGWRARRGIQRQRWAAVCQDELAGRNCRCVHQTD
jgi:hypothetical protein